MKKSKAIKKLGLSEKDSRDKSFLKKLLESTERKPACGWWESRQLKKEREAILSLL